MRFHEAYRKHVLMPDFRFARQYLAEHFLDAMTAHVRTVKRLDDAKVRAHLSRIEELEQALCDLRTEDIPCYDSEVPDLYFAFNQRLEARLGVDSVSFLRLGLSRNDLDMTVYKMRTRILTLNIIEQLCFLRQALLAQAQQHLETILIAQTHHQPGQPTTVAHYLMAVDNLVARQLEKLFDGYAHLNTCPLGSAALAGSSYGLDRNFTASELGFAAPVGNTYEAVASSDWQVEFANNMQSVALTLSRFVNDLIVWSSQGFFRLCDSLVQGSSIMPQKRNPVALEHARTRFSRVLGSAQMVMYSSHNIPYADLNDFGPDIQGALVSLYIQLEGGLELLAACLREGQFDLPKLAKEASCTDTTATELADELTRLWDYSFQEAHHLAASLVQKLAHEGKSLQEASREDLRAVGGPVMEENALRKVLDPLTFVKRRDGLGGPAPERVEEHLLCAVHEQEKNVDRLTQLFSQLSKAHENLIKPGKEKL